MENVCDGISLQGLDYGLVEATLLSFETQTLTPIIKEELKLKIQSKRLAAGKEELPKPVFKEPEKCELTKEEEQKREFRKERNRVAAAKCRNKRKFAAANQKTVLAEEQLKNFTLKRKVETLEKEKDEIIKKLKLQGSAIAQPTSTDLSQSGKHSPSPSSLVQYTTPSPAPLSQSPVPHLPAPVPQSFSPVPTSPSPVPPSPSVVPLSLVPQSPVPPSPIPQSLCSHQESDIYYRDLPSTSSGIYEHDPIPRRFSEDIPRNLGAINYQPRRFSADGHGYEYVTSYNHLLNQSQVNTTAQTFNAALQMTKYIDILSEQLVETRHSTHINLSNQTCVPHDTDFDFLSDEEFCRFENESIENIPFEQYQNVTSMQLQNNYQQLSSNCSVTTDGIKPRGEAKTAHDFDENTASEKFSLDDNAMEDNCILQLLPVFEDEAMVPECDQEESFHGLPGPTSPTFY